MMTMHSDGRHIRTWGCLSILLIVGAFALLDFHPQWSQAAHLEEKLRLATMTTTAMTQAQRERQDALEEEAARIEEGLELLQHAMRALQDKVIPEDSIPLVTEEIAKVAAASNIELMSIRPLDTQDRNGYRLLPIEIRFQGGYAQLIQFLSRVETSPFLAMVHELTINQEEQIAPNLSIQLTASVLMVPEAEGHEGSS